MVGLLVSLGAEAQTKPPEITEIAAPEPDEISGVAAIPEGYAVVGDKTGGHGRIWPGGATWPIDPPLQMPESLDVEKGQDGKLHWFILDERLNRLVELEGRTINLRKRFEEVCGRGLEGLAVRLADDGGWDIAVLYEGGFYNFSCKDPRKDPEGFTKPRVAIMKQDLDTGLIEDAKEFDLKVEVPAQDLRFRAPDLVWDGDGLLVLLSSLDKEGNKSGFAHKWLQHFDLDGNPAGDPTKLEDRWNSNLIGKNWEALDWTLDGRHLVMGYDSKSGGSELVIFPWPYPPAD
jgi:hypothetical protein